MHCTEQFRIIRRIVIEVSFDARNLSRSHYFFFRQGQRLRGFAAYSACFYAFVTSLRKLVNNVQSLLFFPILEYLSDDIFIFNLESNFFICLYIYTFHFAVCINFFFFFLFFFYYSIVKDRDLIVD